MTEITFELITGPAEFRWHRYSAAELEGAPSSRSNEERQRRVCDMARGAYVDGQAALGYWVGACALCPWRYGPSTIRAAVAEATERHDIDMHRRYSASYNRRERRRAARGTA